MHAGRSVHVERTARAREQPARMPKTLPTRVRRTVWEFDAEREPSLFLFSHVKIMVDFPRRTLQQVEV